MRRTDLDRHDPYRLDETDLVAHLLAQRAQHPSPPVTDDRLRSAGLLTGDWEDGAA
ncbi:hypothetical protein [Nocardioides donggukensis]|uniref:Uncharacterized protein n=1 Tax=Nocardioides donggukensis TaxID=2774019 RepID=A0A927K2H4_9ACTN|nr:hypothetical protein [Nocardioides donggukensis]MBD8868819.1 hypothetical protein [Nocardioides donggukensis]